jgi:hypothetical protein
MPRLSASPDAVLSVLVATLQAQNSSPFEVRGRLPQRLVEQRREGAHCVLSAVREWGLRSFRSK